MGTVRHAVFVVGPALGHIRRSVSVAMELEPFCERVSFVGADLHGLFAAHIPERFARIALGIGPREDKPVAFAREYPNAMQQLDPALCVYDLEPLKWLSQVRLAEVPSVFVTNAFLALECGQRTYQDESWNLAGNVINQARESLQLKPLASARSLYRMDLTLLDDPSAILALFESLPPSCVPMTKSRGDTEEAIPLPLAGMQEFILVCSGSTGDVGVGKSSTSMLKQQHADLPLVTLGRSALCESFATIADVRIDWTELAPLLQHCRFLICHGGTGCVYAALQAGVPVVVVPSHQNHRVLGRLIEAAGFGFCVEPTDGEFRWDRDWDQIARHVASHAGCSDSDWIERVLALV